LLPNTVEWDDYIAIITQTPLESSQRSQTIAGFEDGRRKEKGGGGRGGKRQEGRKGRVGMEGG